MAYNFQAMKRLLGPATYESNITRFLLARALTNAMFFLPIWVIFVQEKHGIDLLQATLLDSAFWLTMALTEIPTGAVADTIGRKHSHAIGIVLSIAGLLLFTLSPTYPLLLIGNSLWALALTFSSGADLAFFYDSLRELGRTAEYPRYRSIVAGVDIVATGLSAVVGSVLYRFSPEMPFMIYLGMLALSFLIVLTFREPPAETHPETGLRSSYLEVLKTAARALRTRAVLRNVLMYSNLLPVAGAAIGITLIQPHVVGIGLPVESLGVVLLGINLVRILGTGSAAGLTSRLGDWRLLVLAPLLIVAGVYGIGYFPGVSGLLVFGLAVFSSAAARPTIETILMAETPGTVRATVLSVDSLIFRLLLALVSPLAGFLAEASSLPAAFRVLGLGAGFLLAANLFFWSRARQVAPVSPMVSGQRMD